MKKNLVIILAGGTGSRIDNALPKQFFMLKGKTVIQHTVERFENHPAIHDIFIVTNGEFLRETENIVEKSGFRKVVKILIGGAMRQDSSRIGIEAAGDGDYENLLIHDAARPFVSRAVIDDILETLQTHRAVNVAIPSADTVVRIDDEGFIRDVPDRTYLRRVQTPQAFKLELIKQAHRLALEKKLTGATDDCSLVLKQDLAPVYVVEGSPLNIKITYPIDLKLAEAILERMANEGSGG